jgi:Secretion system C-terminal sorting domain
MKKNITFFVLMLFSILSYGQSGTTVSYNDNFGPATLSWGGLVNGKHSYSGSGIWLYYSGTRWEIHYNTMSAPVGYYSLKATTSNPPNFTVGAWVDALPGPSPTGDATTLSALSGSGTTATLPIELVEFDVNTEGSKNNLTWRTESEKNNSHFDIERSTDGKTFHNIGQVKGNNKPSSYQFVDNQPFATSYYRLRQIDFDGTETLSKVVSVELKGKSKGLKVYPTLVSNGILTVDTEGGADYAIYNLFGQTMQTGKTQQQLNVSALTSGTYILKVGTEQAKFVKQ